MISKRVVTGEVGINSSTLYKTTDYEYDGGGVGDGNLTTLTEHPGVGQDDRITQSYYDWRDRLMATKEGVKLAGESGTGEDKVQRRITFLTYDNDEHIKQVDTYDGDNITLADSTPADGVWDAPAPARLRSRSTFDYDDQGRLYAKHVFGVTYVEGGSPSATPSDHSLDTDVWYDRRGNQVKVARPGTAVLKLKYDGAGRITQRDLTDGSDGGGWSNAQDVQSGEKVVQTTKWTYDQNGNVTLSEDRQRAPDDTGAGALAAPANPGSLLPNIPTRMYYVATYYDAVNRPTTRVDVGDHGGYAYTRPSSPPSGDPVIGTASSTPSDNTTSSLKDTGLSGSTDAYAGYTLTITSGTDAGQNATITAYNTSTHVLSFTPALTAAPTSSGYSLTDARVTTYSYDDAGRLEKIYDPRKDSTSGSHIASKFFYDLLGRTTKTIENWTSDASSARDGSTNRTTLYDYTGEDEVKRLKAALPNSGSTEVFQVTEYVYGDPDVTIQTISATSGFATVTTTGNHGYRKGEYVTLRDTGVSAFNGTFVVTDTPDGTHFKFAVGTSGTASAGSVRRASFSNDVLSTVKYPDKSSGSASSTERETLAYNQLGDRIGYADRNATVHAYGYDVLGRFLCDSVTLASGSSVDNGVLRLDYNYDSAGRLFQATSYNSASGGSGSIVNQVQRAYNGLGQLMKEYQEDAGAVNTSSALVQYAYSHDSSSASVNHSRRMSMTYPDGRQLSYTYNSGLDDSLSRLSSQKWSGESNDLEEYVYLGLRQIVGRIRPEAGTQMLFTHYSGTGDPPPYYFGLDRFGRIASLQWTDATGDITDGYNYGYDLDNNVLYKENIEDVNSAGSSKSELYHTNTSGSGYDDLDRLKNFQRGTLNATHDQISSASRTQDWTLDAVGNWSSVSTGGFGSSRTHNKQNQITNTNFTYDANGNMTHDAASATYSFDAWNRLRSYASAGFTAGPTYQYDALGRRLTEENTAAAQPRPTIHFYYSDRWQMILEQSVSSGGVEGNGADPGGGGDGPIVRSFATSNVTNRYAYVWSPEFVDCLVSRDKDASADGTYEQRLYAQQDANYNVTSVTDTGGVVQERYLYDPYGTPTYFANDYTSQSSSGYNWRYLHQGGRYDPLTGLSNFRLRDYSPSLGRWTEQDPFSLAAGNNLYAYCDDGPLSFLDPFGLDVTDGGAHETNNIGDLPKGPGQTNPYPPINVKYSITQNTNTGDWEVSGADADVTVESTVPSVDLVISQMAKDPQNPTDEEKATAEEKQSDIRERERIWRVGLIASIQTNLTSKLQKLKGQKGKSKEELEDRIRAIGQEFLKRHAAEIASIYRRDSRNKKGEQTYIPPTGDQIEEKIRDSIHVEEGS